MTDAPADFTISMRALPGQAPFIRLQCKDGLHPICTMDLSLEDFTKALLGQEVLARYSGAGK